MAFNQAAVNDLFDRVQSHAMTLALFETVNTHEPKSKPGNGLRYALWVQEIRPVGQASGLSSTSGVVELNGRIYSSALQQPYDAIDPDMLTACTTLLGAYSGDFDLGGTVLAIDLLGMYGASMSATAGYLTLERSIERVMTIVIPVIIDALWTQNP